MVKLGRPGNHQFGQEFRSKCLRTWVLKTSAEEDQESHCMLSVLGKRKEPPRKPTGQGCEAGLVYYQTHCPAHCTSLFGKRLYVHILLQMQDHHACLTIPFHLRLPNIPHGIHEKSLI